LADDFRVGGLELGDALICYVVSGVEVRIAQILYAHQRRSWGCTPLRMHSPDDFRVSGLEVGDPIMCYLVSDLEVGIALILYAHQGRS